MLVNPRAGLKQYLLDDGTISGLVSSRVYPVTLPQGVRETSIVYHRISETESLHMQGPSGLVAARFQIDAISKTADGAANLADAIKERLNGFAGTITFGSDSPPSGEIKVQGVFISTGSDDYDAESQLYRMTRDYVFWFAERN